MSEIKDVIEMLSRDWSWDAVAKHDLRKKILTCNRGCLVACGYKSPPGPISPVSLPSAMRRRTGIFVSGQRA